MNGTYADHVGRVRAVVIGVECLLPNAANLVVVLPGVTWGRGVDCFDLEGPHDSRDGSGRVDDDLRDIVRQWAPPELNQLASSEDLVCVMRTDREKCYPSSRCASQPSPSCLTLVTL